MCHTETELNLSIFTYQVHHLVDKLLKVNNYLNKKCVIFDTLFRGCWMFFCGNGVLYPIFGSCELK